MRLGLTSIVVAAFGAALLSSCAGGGKKVDLAGDPSELARLEAILAGYPLPSGWSVARPGDAPRVAVELVASGSGRDGAGAPAGRRWLVPALPLADPRFSLSEAEARSLGLRPLEDLLPPLRAPAVGGVWPGQEGYPFFEDLRLSARAVRGKLPREISAWILDAARRSAAGEDRPLVLGAVGDIQVGPREGALLVSGEEGRGEVLRGGLLPLLASFDFLVGNLEGQISARGEPNPRKRYLFRFPPGTAAALKSAGFGLLLFGNNHALDYGYDAFRDTLSDFEGAGLPYVGAGLDAAGARAVRRIGIPGSERRFSFVGFASFPKENMGFSTEEAAAGPDRPGVNADEEETVAAIKAAAAEGDAVIVLSHGGREYVDAPPDEVRQRYRRFADAGAVLVIGSHPHVLQGFEARGSSLIAYSLGNFLFTGEAEPPAGQRGALVSILMYRGLARGIRLHPLRVAYDGSSPSDDRAAAESRFAALCAELARRPGPSP